MRIADEAVSVAAAVGVWGSEHRPERRESAVARILLHSPTVALLLVRSAFFYGFPFRL